MEYDITKEYCQIIKGKITLGEFESAMVNAEKLIRYDANSLMGHYLRGICNFALNNYDESFRDYENAIKSDPNFAKAHFNLGIAKYYSRDFKAAIDHIRIADSLFKIEGEKESSNKCVDAVTFIKKENNL